MLTSTDQSDMRIQDFINNREKYLPSYSHGRIAGAWTLEDRQCLIDSILRGWPIGVFIITTSEDGLFHIIDGKQRLDCILQFFDNKFELNSKFSGEKLGGTLFTGDFPLNWPMKIQFLSYELNFHVVEPDREPGEIFQSDIILSRLHRCKPLSLGERLYATAHGLIGKCMVSVANHPFVLQFFNPKDIRYSRLYPNAARMLLYTKYGAINSNAESLRKFFERENGMHYQGPTYKETEITLDHVIKCFPAHLGGSVYLKKYTWALTVFSVIHELRKKHSLTNEHEQIGAFIKEFYDNVHNEDIRRSTAHYQKFYDYVRWGWSAKSIAVRRDILMDELLSKLPLLNRTDS